MLKFLPGIILIQLVTGGLILMIFNWSQDFQLIIVMITIALICAVLSAFWFSSISRNMYYDEHSLLLQKHATDREKILKQAESEKTGVIAEKSQLQDQYARERERILVEAERDKANVIAESYREIEKQTRKVNAKANFKVGAAFALAAGAGGIMIFSQLITVGMMLMVGSGSGLSGYLLRARHERLTRNKQLALTQKED